MTKAVIYARISSDPEDTGLGVQRQIQDCAELAARLGWSLAGPAYVDNDVSATSGKARKAYDAMMEGLRAGRFDALVVWDVDRLTRTPRELEDVVDLAEKHGLQLASVGGAIDLATPQGRLTARIKGSVARHESEQLARRVRRKMVERATEGKPHGRVAYGWSRRYEHDAHGRVIGSTDVLDPVEAEVVRDAARRVIAGESLRSIVRHLTDTGAPTATNKPWDPTALRGILLRDRNAGFRIHQGARIGRGDWEPIFDEATLDRVTAILTDPTRRTSPASSAVKYLLSGIARCGVCEGPMRVLLASSGRRSETYVCQEGYHVRRLRAAVDDLVRETVVGFLSMQDAAVELFADPEDDEAQRAREEADVLEARLDLAADAFSAGDMDIRAYTRISADLRPRIEERRAFALSVSTAPDLVDMATPDISERWDSIPLARRRAAIDRLVTVRVLPVARTRQNEGFAPLGVEILRRDTAAR